MVGGFKEGEWGSDVCVGRAGAGWLSRLWGEGLEPSSVVRLWGSRIWNGGCCIHLARGDVGMYTVVNSCGESPVSGLILELMAS